MMRFLLGVLAYVVPAFTVVQWIIVGPLTALAFGRSPQTDSGFPARNVAG